jgi:L-fuculose-phosphate aldolase
VPLVPYHLFGTEALSQGVGAAMAEVDACLLANHGLIAAGESLARAEKVLAEIEALCGIYLQALAVGEPALLTAAEMAAVHERFRGYGRASRAP